MISFVAGFALIVNANHSLTHSLHAWFIAPKCELSCDVTINSGLCWNTRKSSNEMGNHVYNVTKYTIQYFGQCLIFHLSTSRSSDSLPVRHYHKLWDVIVLLKQKNLKSFLNEFIHLLYLLRYFALFLIGMEKNMYGIFRGIFVISQIFNSREIVW